MRIKPQLRPRRRYIVDKDLQYRLIRSVTWPMAVVLVVAIGLPIELKFLLKNKAALAGATSGLSYFFVATVGFFAFALIAQILIAIQVSHQVAGPVYRIRETLESFRQGDHQARARLRKHDLLKGFAADVNEFLEWTEARVPPADSGSSPADPKTATRPAPGAAPRAESGSSIPV